ncbi:uncharacterized protein PV09_08902 [Verruconis gallopava]|uniref:Major facilitator superfamily (MFS) profile domain-containing protein n=1 Tax=Verruconis gallopava TaxID=253628 RepID=A0A0D1ZYH8_9PEZI|nr:uncharacterized protein PV09_08902 [Verruconis gallopava]KIV99482.1 hypothetical protein PV09_08902 [Verruconis gallopava]
MPDIPHMHRSSTYNQRSRSYLTDDLFEYNRKPQAMGSLTMDCDTIIAPSTVRMSTLQDIMFIGVVAAAQFCTQFGLGMTLAPLDVISQSFGVANVAEQSWMIAGYTSMIGTFILTVGRLGDIMGHRRALAFGYAWFGVWSGFGGFAVYPQKFVFFDICRALQGVGPAFTIPNSLTLFGRAYSPGIKKNIVFSIFSAVTPAGFVVGAAFGSFFAQNVWWPWAFWSFGIVLWVFAALTLLFVPQGLGEKPRDSPDFDWGGSVMSAVGLLLICIAWSNAPLYGWKTAHVYFLLVIGILCLIAFVWIETHTRCPILPIKTMNGTVAIVLTCMTFVWGAYGIWIFYSFRFLQKVRNSSPLSTAAQFSPMAICGVLAAALTGFLLTHTPVSFVMLMAITSFAVGLIVAATLPPSQPYWAQMFISVIIMPFGMDMSLSAASAILSDHMSQARREVTMSIVSSVVNISISVALGIAGTIELSLVHDLSTPDEMLKGFRYAFYSGVGLSMTGLICGALYFLLSMRKEGWKVLGK